MRIETVDRPGRERLLRCCARPPFALERLRELNPERSLHEDAKLGPCGNGPLLLTPPELLDRLAAPFPPPLLRRAGVTDCSLEISAATASGRRLPN